MADSNFIPKAIEIVREAVVADNNGEYESALVLYKKSLEYFMTGIKYERNEKAKKAIREKVLEYMTRAEELQKHIEANKSKKKTIKSGAGGKNDDKDSKELDTDTQKLQGALSSAIVMEKPNIKWDDVAGLEGAKSLLKEAVILPIKFPQLFTGKRQPWRGILLYGPPGTGKSYLAKAVATEANNSTFFAVSSSDLVSKYQGESERLVRNLFDMAREQKPSIIFIDEIDSLCSNRSDGENESARRIKTEFLVQMQGVGKGNDGLLVLGATNIPWELDPAVRRRFEKRIYIPLPESSARMLMFKIHIGKTPHSLQDEDFKRLGDESDGFSGSDISVLVRDALMEPIRTLQVATHFRKVSPADAHREGANVDYFWEPCSPMHPQAAPHTLMDIESDRLLPQNVTMNDFIRVIKDAKPTVGAADLRKQEEWTKEFGTEGS